MKQRPLWFLLNIYAWVVLAMSIITAILIHQAWVILLGVIGYLVALIVDLIGGRSLGRTGAVRLAMAEQENRELKAEQARLLGAIREREDQVSKLVERLGERGKITGLGFQMETEQGKDNTEPDNKPEIEE
jgi:hypothetical protein